MTTATEARQVHQDLLDAAALLVEEITDAPAGVVLRSYWRAVKRVRHAGCPLPALATEADLVARDLLAARGVRVPHPRRGGRVAPAPAHGVLVPLSRGGW